MFGRTTEVEPRMRPGSLISPRRGPDRARVLSVDVSRHWTPWTARREAIDATIRHERWSSDTIVYDVHRRGLRWIAEVARVSTEPAPNALLLAVDHADAYDWFRRQAAQSVTSKATGTLQDGTKVRTMFPRVNAATAGLAVDRVIETARFQTEVSPKARDGVVAAATVCLSARLGGKWEKEVAR